MQPDVFRKLVDFITHNFMVEEDEIDMDESLIDQGIIDSFGLVEITAFIQKTFGVTVRDEDMTREAFGSTHKMARFVSARLEERATPVGAAGENPGPNQTEETRG